MLGRIAGFVLVAAMLATGPAVAQSVPDGSVAEPGRWTGPHGPASNSRRSRALAVTRDVVEAWSTKLPGVSVASPVTWDGRLFALCAAKRGHILCMIDLRTGKLLAKKQLPKAPAGNLHVWGRNVFLRTSDEQISAFRSAGSSLVQGWKFKAPKIRSIRVIENEIYVQSNGSILRLSPGFSNPSWSKPGEYIGPIAIYGKFVFCASTSGVNGIDLSALNRSNGNRAQKRSVAGTSGGRVKPQLMIAPNQILLSPDVSFGNGTHAFVNFSYVRGLPNIGACTGLSSFGTWPAACRKGVLTMEEGVRWMWWDRAGGTVLAMRKWTPDLFKDAVAPTVVGDIAYFGTWAADIVTGEVLWRLPVRSVRHSPVPADKLVVIVDANDYVRGYRER